MNDPKDLYVMQDGTHATYAEVTRGRDDVLRNKNGVAVAIDADGDPQMVGSDAERNKNVMEADRAKKAAAEAGVMRDVNAGRRPSDEDRRAAGLPPLPAKAPRQPSAAELAKSTTATNPAATKSNPAGTQPTPSSEKREVKAGEQSTSDPNYQTR